MEESASIWKARTSMAKKKKIIRRKYVQANANKHVSDEEYRTIMDMFLEGMPIEGIARQRQREVKGIEKLINNVASNYQGGGERRSPIVRMRQAISKLLYTRIKHTRQAKGFYRSCYAKGRTRDEMCSIFYLPPEEISRMEVRIVGGFGIDLRYQN